MKVLVIAGTGFIGSHAIQRLVARGHEVAVFHRGHMNPAELPECEHILGDRKDIEDFRTRFARFRPDSVVDITPRTAEDGNQLLRTFRGITSHLVVISSIDVYRAYDRFRGDDPGPPDPTPLTEDSPLRDRLYQYREPDTLPSERKYWDDKIVMERAAQSDPEHLPAAVIRLPMVYGQGDDQHRVAGYLGRMDDGRPFILLPEDIAGWRAFRGYVDDVGEAIAVCATHPDAVGNIYHVGGSNFSEREWVEHIGRAAGWKGKVVTAPNDQLPPSLQHKLHTDQPFSGDATKIQTELGWSEVVDMDEAMRRTVAWERANPPGTNREFDYAAEDGALRTLYAS